MKVIKRDGNLQDFDALKIKQCIEAANNSVDEIDRVEGIDLEILLNTIEFRVKDASLKTPPGKTQSISVEEIQDIIENELIRINKYKLAKCYIKYRYQHQKAREADKTLINYKNVVDNYLKVDDWRVKENSTVSYSLGGLILSNSGAVTANYWLSEVYDKEIADAHRNADIHLHDLSMLSGYCAGWSLKQLIQEGLGGVPGKIASKPASHLHTLCNQMVNFLGIMQNEWAGAQAFSSFDTYLAPFVKIDNLTQAQVKQCIQSFVFGVNTPSRWGCVPLSTEVLSKDGFKSYDQLKEGDLIYTWKDGRLELNPVKKVVIKPFKGELHSYEAHGYNQVITPNHRMLVKNFNDGSYIIKRSEEIFDNKTCNPLPVAFDSSAIKGVHLSDDEIKIAVMIYTDGHLDYYKDHVRKVTLYKSPRRTSDKDEIEETLNKLNVKYVKTEKKGGFGSPIIQYRIYGDAARYLGDLVGNLKNKIDSKFLQLNMHQANLFLDTWASFDGKASTRKCQYDNDAIKDALQQIAILAGHTSYVVDHNKTHYVKVLTSKDIYIKKRKKVAYDNYVWCPNVENGTAVFRENDTVFISGQTQAPFSNITLDWTVPNDLAELNCIIGGKEVDFCYKDCQKEMDMVNKAFLEVMIEGDANGRGFQYPIEVVVA